MLQSIKQLYGIKLGASDGDIGHVKDLYFDDQDWTVRYVVADTGDWLPGREVLISPHAFATSHPVGKALLMNLNRKQIEDSPEMTTHKPVSRQYEEEYHRYYGWPFYWEGDGLWGGMRGFPVLETPPTSGTKEPATAEGPRKRADANLRSTQAVSGYHLQATDGIVGHVCDFVMDDRSWAIHQLVIKIGHRFTGKEVLIPVSLVERISYQESTVFAKLTQDDVEKSPEHSLVPEVVAVAGEHVLTL
jgi:sporulation protein YlmC with PRC-barrel domain